MHTLRLAVALAGAAALLTAAALEPATASGARDGARRPVGRHSSLPGSASFADSTGVGVHNAYQRSAYAHFADALDSGASLLELDVWTNGVGGGWRVSHADPVGNDNNCTHASSAAALRTGARDTDLGGCLADMRAWHDAHPGHRPLVIKVEMKDGFYGTRRGPAAFDKLVRDHLGDALFRPSDVVGGHDTLDEAVRAGGWPSRDALKGKFLFELIPGTVEESNPFDRRRTDTEYAGHLRDLAAAGRLGEAAAFPAVHGAEPGDPRTRRYAADLRPWFVVFDGDASAYANGSIGTGWYQDRGYLVVMTDAHKVAPRIDGTDPTERQARNRVARLSADHASFATADWRSLTSVLSSVVPRG